MNRADQALEPSMEDILASIRRIISDDDSGRDQALAQFLDEPEPKLNLASQSNNSYATSLNALAEEDILDLTDELVFADKVEALAAEEADREVSAADGKREPRESIGNADRNDHVVREPVSRSGNSSNHSPANQPHNRKTHDQGSNVDWSRSSPAVSRPVWSRRDLPESGSPSSSLPARKPTSQEARPQARQREEKKPSSPPQAPSRPWSEDIQMPVPDHGPIPLLGQSEPRTATGKDAGSTSGRSAARGQSQNTVAEPKVEVVAALAQTLAKSAVVSLDDEELSYAQNVDFEHLDEDRKSEVTQKFAEAMSSNHTDGSSSALFLQPGMLDQMLRDDFHRQSAPHDASSDDLPNSSQFASSDPYEEDRHFSSVAKHRHEPEKGHQKDMTTPSRVNARSFSPNISSGQRQTEAQSGNTAVAQAQPRNGSGNGLEEAVREMLRPLLVQWLNENMPRILEDAIREEITMRGLPKLDMLS